MAQLETRPLLLSAVETVGREERIRSVCLHLVRRPDGSEEPILPARGCRWPWSPYSYRSRRRTPAR